MNAIPANERTIARLSKLHKLKLGDRVASVEDGGGFLGSIHEFKLGKNSKNGISLIVVTDEGEHWASLVCGNPDESEIAAMCDLFRQRHLDWVRDEYEPTRMELKSREIGIRECKLR